jgi:hypothetical protein
MRYEIKKNKFSASGIHLGLNLGRVSQTYRVRFDSSCLYDKIDWENDWNKLIGFSLTNLPVKRDQGYSASTDFRFNGKDYIYGHHLNSVRFVWRANKDQGLIEIAFYYYQDGVRTIEPFTMLKPNVDYILGITMTEGSNRVILTAMEKGDSDELGDTNHLSQVIQTSILNHPFKAIWSYDLFPYFGGNNPAPHDMSLEVTKT